MITTDYPAELYAKVVTAIGMSFSQCLDHRERKVAENSIIEFLSAMEFTGDEITEALEQASGQDAETDEFIDAMIAQVRADSDGDDS